MQIRIAVAIGICIIVLNAPLTASPLRIVALSDDDMPNAPKGQTFEHFAPPLLNDRGQTAFFSGFAFEQFPSPAPSLPAGDRVWSEGSGTLSLIASPLSAVPSASENVTFGFFNQLGFNNAGKTVIRANLRGTGVTSENDFATYIDTAGGLKLVSRTGDPAPGLPGEVFGPLQALLLNDADQIAFRCDVGQQFSRVNSIWLGELGSLNLIARTGEVIPGTPVFISQLRNPVLNDRGEVAFSSATAIWLGSASQVHMIARRGDSAPGTSEGEEFDILLDPTINTSGHVAFYASLSGTTNHSGIWSDRSGELSLVLRTGDPVQGPPSDVVFNSLHGPVLNDADYIAFWAELAGSGVTDANDTGIWSDGTGSIALVAREGDPAPGLAESLLFGEFDRRSFGLNVLGQIAFLGRVTGDGITTANDIGIWATDQFGALHLIAREGDVLEVRPNEFRTISQLWFFTESGNADSRRSAFNDVGQLAFLARFSDSTEGIFVSDLVAMNVPGDYNGDDTVDAADYVVWRKSLGQTVPRRTAADGNGNGTVDSEDYNVWRTNFGNSRPGGAGSSPPAVPEPSGKLLLVVAFGIGLTWTRNGSRPIPSRKRA